MTQTAALAPSTTGVAASLRSRIVLAIVIAALSGVYTWYQHGYLIARKSPPDSLYLWRAANALVDGVNPWQKEALNKASAMGSSTSADAQIHLVDPLYYPMPAVLIWTPLARLPYLTASTVFNICSAFFFVIAITREGLHRAWACGSVPFMVAMRFGQWSPLLVVAWAYPAFSAFLVAKPNLGVAMYASRFGRMATVTCIVALVVPTMLAPWWVPDWLRNVQQDMGHSAPHPAPITMFSGAGLVLLLALSRWRRPEARLVALLACVPQLPYWADQLPLMLVADGRREMQAMMLATLIGFLCWAQFGGSGDVIDTIRPYAVAFTYGPALVLVLRRKNEGQLHAVAESFAARFRLLRRPPVD